ncbi:MAG: tetratricopeptide repeat protein, partial [Anaerolineae bacterium]|nr:tetratricopeptide repeat protein [Anaerolineae bacterium]
ARLFSAVSQLVSRIAQRKPMLWVIDDAQWLGDDALELLAYILRRNTEAPLCVVLAERPEPPLNIEAIENAINRNNVQLIELKALDIDSARKLAEATLGKQASPNAVQFVVQRADGNPLFIQELANMLKAERPTREAIASVNETLSLPVPVRIARVMANRLAELHDVQRRILEWAAVFGREFNLDLLANALDESANEVSERVDVLLKRQVLQERRTRSSEMYRFAQQQLREVVYGELSARRKRTMHGTVANAMEREGSASPADLEFHFGESGDDSKAVRYGVLAGDRAREAYANQDALRFYQRVLERAGDKYEFRDSAAHAHFGLGETHRFLGHYPQAKASYERVLALTT